MNYPFKFTYASTNDYGLLWNPHKLATGGTDKSNAVLTGLAEPSLVGLVPPFGNVYVTGLVVMTDAVGGVPVTLGIYDTVTSTFHALYPILATDTPGGGVADVPLDSLYCPLGKTRLLCLRNDGAAGGVVSGHVKVLVPPADTFSPADASVPLLDEAHTFVLLAEDGNILLSEKL